MTLYEMVILWITVSNFVLFLHVLYAVKKIEINLERQWTEQMQRELRRFSK